MSIDMKMMSSITLCWGPFETVALETLYGDQFAFSTQLIEQVILSLITVCLDKSTRPQIGFSRTMKSIVQRLLVTVYHILCNTVYFIITRACMASWMKKVTSKSTCFPCILSPFSSSLWALSVKITFVSGQILSQNVEFVMTSLIISACAKTWNSKTKLPKRNDRYD